MGRHLVAALLACGLLAGCGAGPAAPAPTHATTHGPSAAQVRAAEHRVTTTVSRLATLLQQQYAVTVAYPRSIDAVRALARGHHLLAPHTRVEGWSVHLIVRHEWFALCVETSASGQPVSGRYDSRSYGTVTAGVRAC